MLALTDPRWESLLGGHRTPYDPRPAIAKLELDVELKQVWRDLWENLVHEGQVGEASYAVVPHLVRLVDGRAHVDWHVFALIATIEVEREVEGNPEMPEWLEADYEQAWERLFEMAKHELSAADASVTLRCLLATIALAKGDARRGRMLLEYDDDELDELLGGFEMGVELDD